MALKHPERCGFHSPREGSSALTHEVLHHGWVVMRGRRQAQQLLAAGHGGVVDGLHVDVVLLQQAVAQRGVQLGVAHLPQGRLRTPLGGHWKTFVVVFTGGR